MRNHYIITSLHNRIFFRSHEYFPVSCELVGPLLSQSSESSYERKERGSSNDVIELKSCDRFFFFFVRKITVDTLKPPKCVRVIALLMQFISKGCASEMDACCVGLSIHQLILEFHNHTTPSDSQQFGNLIGTLKTFDSISRQSREISGEYSIPKN